MQDFIMITIIAFTTMATVGYVIWYRSPQAALIGYCGGIAVGLAWGALLAKAFLTL